jgi:hypothetical protein
MDNRPKCLVVQLTFGSGERVITGGQSDEEKKKLRTTLTKAWQRAVTKNKPMSLSIDRILTDQQSKAAPFILFGNTLLRANQTHRTSIPTACLDSTG